VLAAGKGARGFYFCLNLSFVFLLIHRLGSREHVFPPIKSHTK
jgi:hypothetical protein